MIAAPAGAEVVIINQSKTSRTLVAEEDPKLLEPGPINPTGPKSFRPTEAGKVYTIGDNDAPYLIGKLVVVSTQYIAYLDDAGHFEIDDVPAGQLQAEALVRRRLDRAPRRHRRHNAKGKTEVNPKLAAASSPQRRSESAVFLSKIWFFLIALAAAIAFTIALVMPRPAQRQLEAEEQRASRSRAA